MKKLDTHLLSQHEAKLKTYKQDLEQKHRQNQDATQAFSHEPHKTELLTQITLANKEYQQVRVEALTYVRSTQKVFRAEAKKARKKGIDFSKHDAEKAVSKNVNEYDYVVLQETIDLVLTGLTSLKKLIVEFNQFQLKISENIAHLTNILARLEKLEIQNENDSQVLEDYHAQFKDYGQPRSELLQTTAATQNEWLARIQTWLEEEIENEIIRLKGAVAHLKELDPTVLKSFTEQVAILTQPLADQAELNEQTLDKLVALRTDIEQKSSETRRNLIEIITDLHHSADSIIQQLHHEISEVQTLMAALKSVDALEDKHLFAYWENLENYIKEARLSGIRILNSYQEQVREDIDFVFSNTDEIEKIGTVLVYASQTPADFQRNFWDICDDILVRVELANLDSLDAKTFYNTYGIPAIVNTFQVAIQEGDFLRILSFFSSPFSPPGSRFNDNGVELLFENPMIKRAFHQVIQEQILKITPETKEGMSFPHYVALLALLTNNYLINLPLSSRLQWAALLIQFFAEKTPEHRQASACLLEALCDSSQFISLYYALNALQRYYPDIWQNPKFRPLIFHVTLVAMDKDGTDEVFLTELCQDASVQQLAKDDFDSEFILGAIAHYASIHWLKTKLIMTAWAAWEKLSAQYPTFSEVLHRELTGEKFNKDIVVSLSELQNDYERQFLSLENQITNPPDKNHTIVNRILNWYTSEYFQKWLKVLKKKSLLESELADALNEVIFLKEENDLIKRSFHESEPSAGLAGKELSSSTMRNSTLNRLHRMLDAFISILHIRKQLLNHGKQEIPNVDKLRTELFELHAHSAQIKWAINTLLAPSLPFIDVMLEDQS